MSKVARIRISVDFPLPFAPRIPVIRPVWTRSDTWSSANFAFFVFRQGISRFGRPASPKRFEMPSTSTAAVFNSLA